MNKLALMLLAFLAVSCTSKNPTKNKQDDFHTKQTINKSLVDDFRPTDEYLDSIFRTNNFINVEKIKVNEGRDTMYVLLQQFPEWNDPGDFIKIQIQDSKGNVLLDKLNRNGWVSFGNNYFLPKKVLSQNLIKSNKALLLNNYTGKQLLLFGWVYASEPGLMTIIDLFPKPQVIFNHEFELTGIERKDHYLLLKGNTSEDNNVILNTKTMEFEK